MTLLLASGNPHKLREIRAILSGYEVEIVGLDRYPGLPRPRESGSSYLENARSKALHYHALTGMATLADDSGLEVDALGGAPGPCSARFGGAHTSHTEKIQLLLKRLVGVPREARTARFRCCAVVVEGGREWVAVGEVEGLIAETPAGEGGFGYDPVFYLPGRDRTMAELPPCEKNRISHRARAIHRMALRLGLPPRH